MAGVGERGRCRGASRQKGRRRRDRTEGGNKAELGARDRGFLWPLSSFPGRVGPDERDSSVLVATVSTPTGNGTVGRVRRSRIGVLGLEDNACLTHVSHSKICINATRRIGKHLRP